MKLPKIAIIIMVFFLCVPMVFLWFSYDFPLVWAQKWTENDTGKHKQQTKLPKKVSGKVWRHWFWKWASGLLKSVIFTECIAKTLSPIFAKNCNKRLKSKREIWRNREHTTLLTASNKGHTANDLFQIFLRKCFWNGPRRRALAKRGGGVGRNPLDSLVMNYFISRFINLFI